MNHAIHRNLGHSTAALLALVCLGAQAAADDTGDRPSALMPDEWPGDLGTTSLAAGLNHRHVVEKDSTSEPKVQGLPQTAAKMANTSSSAALHASRRAGIPRPASGARQNTGRRSDVLLN